MMIVIYLLLGSVSIQRWVNCGFALSFD